MPHLRKRHIQANLDQIKKFSPIIGIFGHRQVGKTTFIEGQVGDYFSFDDLDFLKEAQLDPKGFLRKKERMTIDECQLAPEIFPALKEEVRKNKKPGRFLLSGSVRFSSRLAIRESLTGRIISLDLFPLTLSELIERPLPESGRHLLECTSLLPVADRYSQLQIKNRKFLNVMDTYLEKGGLPGLCFVREPKLMRQKVDTQLQTILDRDIRLVYPTTLPFTQIYEYTRALALQEGQIWHPSELRKKTRISEITQKKLLQALTAVFMIRLIPCEGSRGGFSIWFEDQFESNHLTLGSLPKEQKWRSLVYRNLREQFEYRLGFEYRTFQYRTRGGAWVPFAFQAGEKVLGVIPILDEAPQRSELFSAHSFLKTYINSKVIFVSKSDGLKGISDRLAVFPATVLLFE